MVRAAFHPRLDSTSTAPLGLALSGGGDSVALLALATPWARAHRRRLITFTVDHGLNPDSPRWTAFAAGLAHRLGAEPVVRHWTGLKPTTGLPAAARAARHALIADAARAHGCPVVLFAHTADDAAEGEWMRAQGASLGRLQEWSPSPAWPEGRNIFLLRPLLATCRADLRAYLRSQSLPWLEDPANADPRYLRTQARAATGLDSSDSSDSFFAIQASSDWTRRTPRTHFSAHPAGLLRLPRASLSRCNLSSALLCGSGRCTPPRGEQLARLAQRLSGTAPFIATLSGARVEASGAAVLISREAGRAGIPILSLEPGVEAVWDGRWLVAAAEPGVTVRPLGGVARRLSAGARRALAEVPAAVRPTLPVFLSADGAVACPPLEPSPHRARDLVVERFLAASGAVQREADVTPHPPLLACSHPGPYLASGEGWVRRPLMSFSA